jgi:inhibitor of KinA
MPNTYTLYAAGDHALTVSFGSDLNPQLNQYVLALANELTKEPSWYRDIIPSSSTLTIVYNPVVIRRFKTASAFNWVKSKVTEVIKSNSAPITVSGRRVLIPVCYDPAFGFDLKALAKTNKLSVDEVIELHTQQTYRVYMLGFLPGFAYMGIVNEKLATPRLATPRKHVPAGSVGIAGNQTGIYPLDSPGGWNIIGRTPLQLFNPKVCVHTNPGRKDAVLFQPGDEVKFYSISKEAFDAFDVQNFNPFAA